MSERNYDELADAAERGQMRAVPQTQLFGADAADSAREALLAATGAKSIEELSTLALGRPRVGERHGSAKTLRVRVSAEQDSLIEAAVASAGAASVSQYVRQAVLERAVRDTKRAAG